MQTEIFERQLDTVIREYESALAKSKHDDASDVIKQVQLRDLQTRCLASIERCSGQSSVYSARAKTIGEDPNASRYTQLAGQIGVAKSLLSDLKNGFLSSLEEIIHGTIFGDFLEMATYLAQNGYKDAAAVLAGSTLESHLRQLGTKHGVSLSANGKPKKADMLNADLHKAGVYSTLDQKSVTSWLDLRNNAAHGNYTAYRAEQVSLLINSVRDLIVRHPA